MSILYPTYNQTEVGPSQGVNLSILTSSLVPPNPSVLLSSNQMSKLMTDLTDKFDLIIFDTPLLALVTDAKQLARQTLSC